MNPHPPLPHKGGGKEKETLSPCGRGIGQRDETFLLFPSPLVGEGRVRGQGKKKETKERRRR
jgi:hypothetical protein